MWNRQLQMVGLAKVTCKRSGNKLLSFYPHSPLLITPGALALRPKVPMEPQTCWKSCATLPWRSWTLLVALKFRPLRGSEFPVAHGQRWAVYLASPRWSCTASVAATSRRCFRCRGWMRRLRCRKRWWWNCCAQPVSVCLYLSLLLTGTVRWFSSCLYINVAFVHALASRQVACSPSDCWHARHLQKPSDVCFDPCEGTFYHSFQHARKDLLSKWFATHEGSNWSILIIISICFVGFGNAIIRFSGFPLLDCWHARHLQKLLCMMQAWEKTPSLTAKTEPRGSEKWSLERFGTAKVPSLRCRKKSCGAEVDRSTCAFHQNPKFLSVKQWIARCHVESKREVAVVSLTCFSLSWLSVLQPLVCSMRGTTWGLRFKSMWRGPQTCR